MKILLKDVYSPTYIQKLACRINFFYPPLREKQFCNAIFTKEWDVLELKQRMSKITKVIYEYLPQDLTIATPILLQVAPEFGGFHGMIFPHYFERFGQNNWALSMQALETLTIYSSSEFAVRPFLQRHPKKMMKVMLKWSTHQNEHVRRLATEGCRPRLPWAMALPEFKKDPSLILPILENLKDDPSEYVRRSVANNLNDISKDNPATIIEIASQWYGKNESTNKLLKHALRTMLKKGEPKALDIFGLGKLNDVSVTTLVIKTNHPQIGQPLEFFFSIKNKRKKAITVRVEYCIYFLKKNNSHSRKIGSSHNSEQKFF